MGFFPVVAVPGDGHDQAAAALAEKTAYPVHADILHIDHFDCQGQPVHGESRSDSSGDCAFEITGMARVSRTNVVSVLTAW